MAQGGLFAKKSVAQIQAEFGSGELKRTLSSLNLVSLGVGAIIGAGIFVLTGNAAANFAGPAVMLSFVIAGLACAFAGLCYAELASTIPVSGSAYSYAYVTLGEVMAWTMGWLLLLEYGVAASTVAAGWTGYVTSLLGDFGVILPEGLTTSTLQLENGVLRIQPSVNLIGASGILAVTLLLIAGVSESAKVNNIIVLIKLTVLLAFIAIGMFYVDPANWTPFIPENEGGFTYGHTKRGEPKTSLEAAAGRMPLCELGLFLFGGSDQDKLLAAVQTGQRHHGLLAAVRKYDDHADAHGYGGFFFWFDMLARSEATMHLADAAQRGELAKQQRSPHIAIVPQVKLSLILDLPECDGAFVDSHELGRAYGTAMALLSLDALDRASR